MFRSSTHCEKTYDIFGILRKFWVRSMCFLCKNIDLNIWVFWPDPDLTSVKSKHWCRHRVKWPSLSISTCKMDRKTCVARHVCDFYFLVTFLTWPWPVIFINGPGTHEVSFLDTNQHFLWVWAFRCQSNRPYSPKCENSAFLHLTWPWPYT